MKIAAGIMLACVLLIAGCGDRPGKDSMYELIESSTDCDWLGATFISNFAKSDGEDSAEYGYAEAAAEQRQLLGC